MLGMFSRDLHKWILTATQRDRDYYYYYHLQMRKLRDKEFELFVAELQLQSR